MSVLSNRLSSLAIRIYAVIVQTVLLFSKIVRTRLSHYKRYVRLPVTALDEKRDKAEHERQHDYNGWPNNVGFDGSCGTREADEELIVTGTIPSYCYGTLYRTGPSSDRLQTSSTSQLSAHHWFDGFAQVYKFQILPPLQAGEPIRVSFHARSTTDYGKPGTGSLEETCTFGQCRDPCESFFAKVSSTFHLNRGLHPDRSVSPNLNVVLLDGAPGLPPRSHRSLVKQKEGPKSSHLLTATSDSNGLLVIDGQTLEAKTMHSQTALHRSLQGPVTASHYSKDPNTGDLINFNLIFHPVPIYRVFQTSATTGKTEILATICDAPPAYIHSMSITERYAVLCVWGSYYSWKGLKVLWTQNVIDALNPMDPKSDCLWYVIDRTASRRGVVATYTTEAFFAFHTVNAYEETRPDPDGRVSASIIADVATYDDLSVLQKYYYNNVRSNSTTAHSPSSMAESARARLTRFRLPNLPSYPRQSFFSRLARRPAQMLWRAPSQSSVETPSIHPKFVTKKHRYVYGITNRGLSTFFDGVGKFDTHTQDLQVWDRHGHTPGEPIFVPDPDAKVGDEDAGVLLTVVLDGFKGSSYLVVLNAKSMKEVGRAEGRNAIAFGFHGLHVRNQDG